MNPEKIFLHFSQKKITVFLICLFLIGILLSLGSRKSPEKEKKVQSVVDNFSDEKYHDNESKLKSLLSKVDGLGENEVMIIYNSEHKKTNSNIIKFSDKTNSESDVQDDNDISGIIIVAEGGDNAELSNLISQTVSDTFGIARYKVKILKMCK